MKGWYDIVVKLLRLETYFGDQILLLHSWVCVTLGQILNLPVPQSACYEVGMIVPTSRIVMRIKLNNLCYLLSTVPTNVGCYYYTYYS